MIVMNDCTKKGIAWIYECSIEIFGRKQGMICRFSWGRLGLFEIVMAPLTESSSKFRNRRIIRFVMHVCMKSHVPNVSAGRLKRFLRPDLHPGSFPGHVQVQWEDERRPE